MKDIGDHVDIEALITEVEKHPEVWNLRSDDYGDKNRKNAAWMEVSRVACSGFEDRDDKEKAEICCCLARKWRNIKDTYLKTLKKTRAGFRCRTYLYAKQLNFVKKVYFDQESGSNFNLNQPVSIENSCDEDYDESAYQADYMQSQDDDSPPSPPKDKTRRKRKRSFEQKPHETPLEPCIKIEQPISLTSYMDTTAEHVQPMEQSFANSAIQPVASPNQAFFNSLLPIVDGFTLIETVDFRLEVLNTIKRMQNARRS